MDLQLAEKSVLVTAGSRGLGFASALRFAAEGANVTIASRNEDSLAKSARQIEDETGRKVHTVKLDVNQLEDIARCVDEAVAFGNGLDVLVCNAGGPPSGGFEQTDDSAWYQAFEQNLLSVIRLTREALPHLKQSGVGRVVNITSTSIKQPIGGLILSNTMRAGVWALTKSLSAEFAPYGILINTVAPGRIATDRVAELDDMAAQRDGVDSAQVVARMSNQIPLGRYGSPEEFADPLVFLASPRNTYITGQALLVDGGMIRSL